MRRILVTAIALALAGVSSAALAQTQPARTPASPAPLATTQLPREVRPTHYEVAVVPHADALRFDGKVTVAIDVLAPTSSITLNAVDLAFAGVKLTPDSGKGTFAAPGT